MKFDEKQNTLDTLLETIDKDILTDDVKEKMKTIFESSLNEVINEKVDFLEKKTEEWIQMKESELEDATVSYLDDEILPVLSSYMEYSAKEYFKENEIALTEGLKAEKYETILDALNNVLKENNIDPEKSEEDEKLYEENRTLKDKLNRTIKEKMEIENNITGMKAIQIFNELSKDLTESEKSKLESLVEDLGTNNLEEFSKKVKILKESIKGNTSINKKNDEFDSGDTPLEGYEDDDDERLDEGKTNDNKISDYLKNVKKYI